MQDTMKRYVFLPIPAEVIEESGLKPSSLVQYSVSKNQIIIEAVEDVEGVVCSGDCADCPLKEMDCPVAEQEEEMR